MTQSVALHKKTRARPDVRSEALRLAAEQGAAAASRQTGVPASTIRSWRRRNGDAGPPAGVDPVAWSELKETAARDTWQAATAALAKVNELLEAGKTGEAQKAALTMAIALDKSLLLEASAAAASDRQARVTRENADVVFAVLRAFFEALGLPFEVSSPLAALLADLLRQVNAGGTLKPSAERVEAARAELQRAGSDARELALWQAIGGKDPVHLSPKCRRTIAAALAEEAARTDGDDRWGG